jgi:hypothetical protein
MSERTSSDGPGLGMTPGMSDDAADTVFGSGGERSGGLQEDGQAVGAADHAADRLVSGADDEGDTAGDRGARSPYELVTGDDEPPASEDGEAVGSADRDADVERSR